MAAVRNSTSLHEKTVKKAASGLRFEAPRSRRTSGRSSSVTSAQVNPLAMEAAQRALRPGMRIVVVSTTEVMIVNRETDPSGHA